jgi:6-phosphogluconate dehydrogenase
MQLGMVGLGRMGANMIRRVMRDSHHGVVFDRDPAAVTRLASEGAAGAASLRELVAAITPPRNVSVMVPAGAPTEQTVTELAGVLEADDCVIDGGNSYFKDDVRRARQLAGRGIHYLDVGTSGGVWGLERGYCLMIGGPPDAAARLDLVFRSLAPGGAGIPPAPGSEKTTAPLGYLHCGPSGAGHFVKMVHNGIEYGLMQSYAEGFDIFRVAGTDRVADEYRYRLDLAAVAELWRRGSVVASWLLDLCAQALAEDPGLARFTGFVQDSGEGRWTLQTAIDQAVPAEVLAAALFTRLRSRQDHTFAEKMLSAMRQKFGGHVEPKKH